MSLSLEGTNRGAAFPPERKPMDTSTILVVDDEPEIRRVLRAQLVNAGYDVVEVKNGEEAIETNLRERPHVILLDGNMPQPQDKLALGENEVRQLMLLIDTNNNGEITKNEWMAFMEAEFDRLDKNKTGELDPKELAHSRIQVSHFLSAGK